uniref:NADH-ubiquinone oxidoreductase chain 4 n=1 Tax=Teloganodidae sp. MT-2014 TaxID=1560024 RepID=A0A0A0RYR5_9INSE|nr:NADH dehydrogenase subunit 4 [Teloganodidae sp. MT-2014]
MGVLFLAPLLKSSKSWNLSHLSLYILSFVSLVVLSFSNIWSEVGYAFGTDIISSALILLTFWISGLMMTASESLSSHNFFSSYFILMVLFLCFMLVLTFSSLDLFYFYLYFEGSLIPTFFLIVGWGYQPERVPAGLYLLFYTLAASLPLLLSIFYLSKENFSFSILVVGQELTSLNFYLYLGLVLAFLVKMPLFLVHLWLPKAHVEAPVAGSMILAGVLLKLGGYGLYRVSKVVYLSGMTFNFVWIGVSLAGGVLMSLLCLRQSDLKALVAYSSVVHMGFVVGGLMSFNSWGVNGALVLMVGHGLCSSGLFCLVNLIYERTGSRSLLINKGLLNLMPSMGLWWFLLSVVNMAAPPSLNLLGEISIINSLVTWESWSMLTIMFISFLSAAYSLFLFSFTQHGKFHLSTFSSLGGQNREYLLLFLHWVPVNFLIVGSTDLFICV